MILGVITYLILSLGVAFWGNRRTIGFLNTLLIGLLLTPIFGLLVVYNSQKLILYHVVEHECPQCGYSFNEAHDHCPLCIKENKVIHLTPHIIPTT